MSTAGARLWTHDKRLRIAAQETGLALREERG